MVAGASELKIDCSFKGPAGRINEDAEHRLLYVTDLLTAGPASGEPEAPIITYTQAPRTGLNAVRIYW